MNLDQRQLLIAQILTDLDGKSVRELTEVSNSLVISNSSAKHQLLAEITVKLLQLSNQRLTNLLSMSQTQLESATQPAADRLVRQIKSRLKDEMPQSNYWQFFDQPANCRLNGVLLLRVVSFDEFQQLVNLNLLTRQDLVNYQLAMLVYFAQTGQIRYFQFLFDHHQRLIKPSDLIAWNYRIIRQAAKFNQFELIEWLIQQFNLRQPTTNQQQSPLSPTNQLTETRLLSSTPTIMSTPSLTRLFPVMFGDCFLLRVAALNGNLTFLQTLKNNYLITTGDLIAFGDVAVTNALAGGYLETAQFLANWIRQHVSAYRLPSAIMRVDNYHLPQTRLTGLDNNDYDGWLTTSSETDETESSSQTRPEVTTNYPEPIILDNFDYLTPVASSDGNGTCPICQMAFLYHQTSETVVPVKLSLTPCRHLFHEKCLNYALRAQLQQQFECPSCKQLITIDLTLIEVGPDLTVAQACLLLKQTDSFSLESGSTQS